MRNIVVLAGKTSMLQAIYNNIGLIWLLFDDLLLLLGILAEPSTSGWT